MPLPGQPQAVGLRAREVVAACAVAALLTVVFTWPLAARLGSAGRLYSGDGRYSVWNVGWVAHALTTDPFHLYDANIFYPATNTLAFSEANIVGGLLAIPVWLATKNAVASTNWVVLCAFTLTALFAYLLVRHLTGSRASAALSALAFGFSPFLFSHLPHIQLLMAFGLPSALLMLHRFDDHPSAGRAAALGTVVAVQALASAYYGVFAALSVGFGFLWFGAVRKRLRDWRYWRAGLIVVCSVIIIVGPFFIPYLIVRGAGFERTLDDARLFSVRWRAYFASAVWVHRWMLPLLGSWREVLFPGFLTVGLAIVGGAELLRAKTPQSARFSRPTILFYVILLFLAIWASEGPEFGLYRALYEVFPIFSFLRAPARFGFLATLCAAVLAGIGLASLIDRVGGRHRTALIAVVIAFAVAESWVGPLQLAPVLPVSAAYEELAARPFGPVAEFPFFAGSADRSRHTEYMLASTQHWKPLVNGYSDFFPEDWIDDMPKLAAFPAREAWGVLQLRNVRYLVIHWALYPPDTRESIAAQLLALESSVTLLVDDPDSSLYERIRWSR